MMHCPDISCFEFRIMFIKFDCKKFWFMRKHVLITGGCQGIGKLVSFFLLERGCQLTVFEIDDEALSEMAEEVHSEDLFLLRVDVSNETEVQQGIEAAIGRFGKLDGLVNNAMISANKPVTELDVDVWNRVLAVNLTGPFLCSKHSATALKQSRGCIINMCSTRALQSEPNTEAYSATKGGLLSLTHALAMSLGPEVRVNAISPGWIDVSAIRKKSKSHQDELSEQDHLQHPAGRVGKGDDIARMIWFLLQAENDFITAQNFVIDGGMTKKMIYAE